MTWYADLTQFEYSHAPETKDERRERYTAIGSRDDMLEREVRKRIEARLKETRKTMFNVGWLDDKHEFLKGKCGLMFESKLAAACKQKFVRFMGHYVCDFCEKAQSASLIMVPGLGNKKYICPDIIHHYVVEHGYRPPNEFVDAVEYL